MSNSIRSETPAKPNKNFNSKTPTYLSKKQGPTSSTPSPFIKSVQNISQALGNTALSSTNDTSKLNISTNYMDEDQNSVTIVESS